ncbi:MAG: WYL domain-containing protein [Fibrobacter sp.]|nr:WYL domain-containing protein [Fibrobacter sp.]
MAEYTKSERQIQILVHLLNKPKQSFSLTQIMQALSYPEADRRNIQRDINSLLSLPGHLVECQGNGPHKVYKSGIKAMHNLELPNFEDTMQQLVFLKRITYIYPGTAALIEDLIERILQSITMEQKDKLKEVYDAINSKVLFMGTQPDLDETANQKLNIILKAIRTRHEIHTLYNPTWDEEKESDRIPLMIVLFQNEIYVACARHGNPEAVYVIKLNRIKSVEISPKTFVENSVSLNAVRTRVRDLSLLDNGQGAEKVVLTIPKEYRPYIEERPFHPSLKIKEKKSHLQITMNVKVTPQLVQWLLFHTPNYITVVEPAYLKEKLLSLGQELVEKYRHPSR